MKAWRINPLFQLGLAAATGGLLIGLVSRQSIAELNQRHLLTELADNHMRSLVAGHLVEVAAWFVGKVNFAPPAPDLTAAGYKLSGGRVEYVAGRMAAALAYQFGAHIISVFLWPETSGEAPLAATAIPEHGHRIFGWSANGLRCYAVADLTEHDLRDFAAAFQAKATP